MKAPKRKVITVEVETYISNRDIKLLVKEIFEAEGWPVLQVQVNEIKKGK